MIHKGVVMRALIAIVAVAMMASCGTSRDNAKTAHRSGSYHHSNGSKVETKPKPLELTIDDSLASETKKLLSEAKSWLGVPYLYGGNDREGVDCSGFVLEVYLKALKISLPRTSRQQNEYCTTLRREQLQPGDLVFFDTKKNIDGTVSHVGLYVGDGNMIHASTSKGVILSSIDSQFYSARFLAGGRVERLYAMQKKSRRSSSEIAAVATSKSKEVKQHEKAGVINPAKTEKRSASPTKERLPEPPAEAPRQLPAPAVNPSQTASADARALVLNSLIEEKIDSICFTSSVGR